VSGDESWPPPGGQTTPAPGWPPPPGAIPPPAGQAPPHAVGWQPHPAAPFPQVHRPGAVPLRPLKLGDLYDAAFKIIRFNAGATVGSTLLVSSVAMLIPTVATVMLAQLFDLSTDAFGEPMTETEVLLTFGAAGAAVVGGLLQAIGLLIVTGMVAVVTHAAAVGRRLSLSEAWALTYGRRWRLLGVSALAFLLVIAATALYVLMWVALATADASTGALVLFGLVSVPLFVVLLVWAWVRFNYLVVPAMMIERTGMFHAFGRAYALTAGQFWRTFGIALLTGLITGVAAQLLATPFSLLGFLAPYMFDQDTAVLVTLVTQALGTVLAAAFVTPFAAAVASLQYLDQRMRKEGYDVELLTEAGITGS
jgi:hypothetical protein